MDACEHEQLVRWIVHHAQHVYARSDYMPFQALGMR
jgi:hypothetical protein